MKFKFVASSLVMLLMTACGTDEQGADPRIDDADEQAAVVDLPPEAPAVGDEETDTGDLPQVVEESVGEPDDAEAGEQAIVLAKAANETASQDWQFKEGQHFFRMVPTQPTLGGADKIEVAEFFWYGCAHCYEFETYINRWAEQTPPNVRFVRIPATWNPLVKLHAQLYYTEEVLVANDKIADPDGFRAAVFAEYHRRGNRLTSESSIRELFARHGVSEDDFNNTWESFEVAQKLRVAQDLARRYAISGVPAMVVNGKYRSGKAETGTYPKLLEVVDELVAREER